MLFPQSCQSSPASAARGNRANLLARQGLSAQAQAQLDVLEADLLARPPDQAATILQAQGQVFTRAQDVLERRSMADAAKKLCCAAFQRRPMPPCAPAMSSSAGAAKSS